MSQQQHTHDPVAWRDGETGFVGRLKGGPHWQPLYQTLPYDHNPDAAARIAELEKQVEMLQSGARSNIRLHADLSYVTKQRDTLLSALDGLLDDTIKAHDSGYGTLGANHVRRTCEAAIASVKEQA